MDIRTAKNNFSGALEIVASGRAELIDIANAQASLVRIASHYPQVKAEEAAMLAVNYISANWAALSKCKPSTILGCFMQLCAMGIPLRTVQPLAYLVPYSGTCTIQIGTEGWAVLARRNYPSLTIRTEFVTAKELADGFSITKGSKPQVYHNIDPMRSDEDAVLMYAVVCCDHPDKITDIKVMTKVEAEKLRSISRSKDVWSKWLGSMWATKLVKKIAKSYAATDPDGITAIVDMDSNEATFNAEVAYPDEAEVISDYTAEIAADIDAITNRGDLTARYKHWCNNLELAGISIEPFKKLFTDKASTFV